PQVETDWITTGRARFIFRDFPGDQLALMAAMTARCLPEPQYYPFVALLFREQEAWLSSEDPVAFVSRVAATAGMDAASLDGCLADRNLQNDILSHQIAARDALGVASTPTIFVNGRRVVGDLYYDDLNSILDDAAES
ncbi:MAG: thioredoxin domain-containing protein, partial [Alphaproteobacteria bacterium]